VTFDVDLDLSGIGTGCLPMRLMGDWQFTNVADKFGHQPCTAAVSVFHQALEVDTMLIAEAFKDARNIRVAKVKPAPGDETRGDPGDGGDPSTYFKVHDKGLVSIESTEILVIGDVAFPDFKMPGSPGATWSARRGLGEFGLRRIAAGGLENH